MGGGINTSLGGKKKKAPSKKRSISNRERKRRLAKHASPETAERKSDLSETDDGKRKHPAASSLISMDFLLQLNEKWNAYIDKMVKTHIQDDASHVDNVGRLEWLSSTLARCELTGGYVQITKCSAHRQWIGKEGLVVGVTANTWRIALLQRHTTKTKKKDSEATVEEGPALVKVSKVLVVPKQNSQLSFRVPLNETPDDGGNARFLTVAIHGNT